ncbi:hypothetical protein KJR69_27240 [Klebsiella pneumoniae]
MEKKSSLLLKVGFVNFHKFFFLEWGIRDPPKHVDGMQNLVLCIHRPRACNFFRIGYSMIKQSTFKAKTKHFQSTYDKNKALSKHLQSRIKAFCGDITVM